MTLSAPLTGNLAAEAVGEPPFPGFGPSDFDVFGIEGLEPRMDALIERIRPKLDKLGNLLAPFLSTITGTEFFPHVAKHARRTVNPPDDTWVAFAANKRGYKACPHFQIGLWGTHVFIQFAVIYEAKNKAAFSARALAALEELQAAIPDDYFWSGNHMSPYAKAGNVMQTDELPELFRRLGTVKAAELLCGVHFDRHDPLLQDGEAFVSHAESIFATLLPLYKLASE